MTHNHLSQLPTDAQSAQTLANHVFAGLYRRTPDIPVRDILQDEDIVLGGVRVWDLAVQKLLKEDERRACMRGHPAQRGVYRLFPETEQPRDAAYFLAEHVLSMLDVACEKLPEAHEKTRALAGVGLAAINNRFFVRRIQQEVAERGRGIINPRDPESLKGLRRRADGEMHRIAREQFTLQEGYAELQAIHNRPVLRVVS